LLRNERPEREKKKKGGVSTYIPQPSTTEKKRREKEREIVEKGRERGRKKTLSHPMLRVERKKKK